MPKPPPKFDWPRQYLLSLYESAVKNGYILVGPIDRERAESLRLSLYRLRRRADAKGANATFILPEYHLVTVGHYREDTSELPILFNKVPEAQGDLPSIRIPDPNEEPAQTLPSVGHIPPSSSTVEPPVDEDNDMDEQALNKYLLEMARKSQSDKGSSKEPEE